VVCDSDYVNCTYFECESDIEALVFLQSSGRKAERSLETDLCKCNWNRTTIRF